MPQRRKDSRVLEPKWDEKKRYWRVTTLDPGADTPAGRRRDRYFVTKEEADEYWKVKHEQLQRLAGLTVEAAIIEYRDSLAEKGTKAGSYEETERRLRLFFPDLDLPVNKLTVDRCKSYYVQRDDEGKVIGGFSFGRSVDYHRNTLSEARSCIRLCVEKGWIKENPLDKVKGFGRRSKGKQQLTADEAFRFCFAALWLTNAGDLGALGSAMLLYMGLRQSEVWKRRVRDLDRNGTVLRVEDPKTPAGERQVMVPEHLQPYLAALTPGRLPMAPLFADAEGGHHTKAWLRFAVKRVCAAAGVPEVTPHGLRGTHASLAERAQMSSEAVARSIGHAGMSAYGNYARPDAVADAAAERVFVVLNGGKR